MPMLNLDDLIDRRVQAELRLSRAAAALQLAQREQQYASQALRDAQDALHAGVAAEIEARITPLWERGADPRASAQ